MSPNASGKSRSKLLASIFSFALILILALNLLPVLPAQAESGGPDVFGYIFEDSTEPGGPAYTWEEISATGSELTDSSNYDDSYLGPIPIGFDFTYYGNTYTDLYVSSNGYISFGAGYGTIPGGMLPDTGDPNNAIIPLGYDKYILGGTSHVYYETLSSPNRFVVEFVALDECCVSGNRSTFEIILYSDGVILTQYQTVTGTTSVVGIENADGTDGLNYPAANVADNLAVRYAQANRVFMLPSSDMRRGLPGSSVIFNQTLFNDTGADDSFDLSVFGSTWPVTLSITNTGVISNNGSITFTVEVDIPPLAAFGDSDDFDVIAASVTGPGNYTTAASLTVLAARLGYVFDSGNDEIVVLDTANHTDTGIVIDITPYGQTPFRGSLTPDGSQLYVSLLNSDNVLIVDTATNTPVTTLDVGDSPHGIAFSSDGAYAFVANQYGGTVSVIDTSVPTVTLTLPVGNRPLSVASVPCLDKVYITNRNDNTVSVIDSTTMTVTQTIYGFASPWDIVVSPFGHRAYVTNQDDGSIGVIDIASDTLVDTWEIGGEWIAGMDISPDGRTLYVADANTGMMHLVDAFSGDLLDTLLLDSEGETIWEVEAFASGAGDYVYASLPYSYGVGVVDTVTHDMVETIPLGVDSEPRGFALFPPETTCLSGVIVAPSGITEIGALGSSVIFVENVFNLTGADDSFDLSISGYSWPATLSITNTGTIIDGGSITFTVQMDIPAGAVVGDSDTFDVMADSVNFPGIFTDAAALTARVPRNGYVFDSDLDLIHVVDTLAHEDLRAPIDVTPFGSMPLRGSLTPDGSQLYVSLINSNNVLIVDTATNTPVTALDVGDSPHGIAFSNDGAYAFVANQGSDSVSVIDTSVPTVTVAIPVSYRPISVAAVPCLDKVYVTNRNNDSVSVIDSTTMTVTQTIYGFAYPWDIVVSPYGYRAYVTNQGNGSIGVIDTINDTLVDTWDVGGEWIAGMDISADGRTLYVADARAGATYIIDTLTGELLDTIVSAEEDAVWEVETFAEGAGDFTYVSVPYYHRIDVIDTVTNNIIETIPVRGEPRGFALFPPETSCLAGVIVAPTNVTQFGMPGGSVSFTEHLINLTGEADSFDLALSGNTWDGSLSITNTGMITPGGIVTFTAQIDIPPSAVASDRDTFTVTAVSDAFPLVYSDTARLTAGVSTQGYIFSPSENTIYIVDLITHQLTGDVIHAPGDVPYPWRGALSPDGRWLYVSLRAEEGILVVDTSTNTSVDFIGLNGAPNGIAFSPDGQFAFVAMYLSTDSPDAVAVIDTASHTITSTIGVGHYPVSVAATPCSDKVYVTNRDSDSVSVIDRSSLAEIASIPGFDQPWDVVVSPYGDRAYVTNYGDGTLSVIETVSDTVIDTWEIGVALQGMDISPDGAFLYVTNISEGGGGGPYASPQGLPTPIVEPGTLVVDAMTGEVLASLPTSSFSSWEVEVFPEGAGPYAYVTNFSNGDVSVLNTATNTIQDTIALPDQPMPTGLALFPPTTICRVPVTNTAPVLDLIGNKMINELASLIFTATASDSDIPTQTLTFTLDAGAPSGAAITPAGVFTWTPTEIQGPGVYTVTVRVTDNGTPALDDFETIQITVNEVNAAPMLDPVGNKTINELALLTFTATASDSDIPTNTLTFSLDAGYPLGAAITPAGTFTWTPTEIQGPGVYTVTVRVTDDGTPNLSDFETIQITVNEVNVSPVLDPIGNKTINELALLTFTATASDSDIPTNTLTFSLDAGYPLGAAITPAGTFTWTPTEIQGPGVYTVTVRVTDDGTPNLSDFETIQITVNEVNLAPQAVDDEYTVPEDGVLSVTAPGVTDNDSDPDLPANVLSVAMDVFPAHGFVNLEPDGAFVYTPTANYNGPDSFIYLLSDGVLTDTAVVLITVSPVNDPPVVDAGPDQGVADGTPVIFSGSFTDPDLGDSHTILWDFGDGITLTGDLVPTHLYAGAGIFTATLTVTDGQEASDSDTLIVTIIPNLQADLAIAKSASPDPVLAGADLVYSLTVTNLGPDVASGVTITDPLPAAVTFVSASAGCDETAGLVTCNVGDLADGGSATVSITVTVDVTYLGELANTAGVSANEADPVTENNSATTTVTVVDTLVILDDDFDDEPSDPWCTVITTTSPSGEIFLGEFNNETTCVIFTGLPTHGAVTFSFDLYLLRSWDGNQILWPPEAAAMAPGFANATVGPDHWSVSVDGHDLLNTTFSNWDIYNFHQAYPGSFPGGDYPARYGAVANNSLGYTFGDYSVDSIYHLTFTIPHTGGDLRIDFTGWGLQAIDDESWGLDNVTIAVLAAEPVIAPYKVYLPIVVR